MKKHFLILPLLAWILSSGTAFAAVGVQEDGTSIGQAVDINFSTGLTATSDGSTVTVSGGAVGTDGNFTSDGLAVSCDLAPTKFIFTASSGNLACTGFTAGTGDLTLENDQTVDGGTNNLVKIGDNGDTLNLGWDGSNSTVDSSDGAVIFLMTQADGDVMFKTDNDNDDYMSITTAANVPTITTSGTSNLAIVPDGGTVAVTGAITASAGITASSTITLQNAETIVNSTNNTVEVGGGTNTILSVLDTGTSDSDAMLLLRADASADNGDDWRITSDGGTNSLFLENDTSGSQATKLTLDKNGIITTTNDIIIDGTTPQLTIGDVTGQASPIIMEGATADTFETTLAVVDPTADNTFSLPDASGSGMISTLATNSITAANSVWGASNGVVYEGATADAFETTLAVVDPTADQTASLPNMAVNYALMASTLTTNKIDAANSIWFISNATVYEGATADTFETTVTPADPTADQTITIPNNGANSAYVTSSLTTNAVDAANSVTLTSNGLIAEGATADAFEDTVSFTDPTADQTITFPNMAASYAVMVNTLTTNSIDAANSVWYASNSVVWEGATADAFETTISPVDPTADQTISIPNNGANSALVTSSLTTNAVDAANAVTLISSGILAEGSAADASETTVSFTNPTADRTVTIPDQSGTVHMSSGVTALTPGAAVTLTVVPGRSFFSDTIVTDNQDQTITFSGAGSAGDEATIIFTTDSGGANDEVITFHTTLTDSAGTLTLANLTAQSYCVTFVSNGSVWKEVARTAVLS